MITLNAGDLYARQQSKAQPTTNELLKQLDADHFQTREAAAKLLARQGERALKPMVEHSFVASPESAWRIRSVIETIGTAGQRKHFL